MSETVQIPRQESLMGPEIRNPFVHRFQFTVWDYIRIAFMSVTIAPIRFFLAFSLLALDWFTAKVGFIGRTEEDALKPMTGWRRALKMFMLRTIRFQYFLGGWYWIRFKGEQASADEAPILVVGPHSSFHDAPIFMSAVKGGPQPVERIEDLRAPIFGTLVDFLQPVYVSRNDPNSRLNTIKEIKRRCQPNSGWPQIVIFPEGTCTNRSCLISFKGGAFYPGVPVQPIAMRYLTKPDTFTWTWDGPGAFALLWLTMCNFDNKLEIEFLPVYKPSQAEIDDPKLFAHNVRAVISKALNIPVTDHTYEDCRLMDQARAKGLPQSAGIVEFQKILNKLGVKLETMQDHLERFVEIAQSEGYITIDDLASYLNLPVSAALKEMFSLYDRDGRDKIDFREYVIGCSLLADTASGEETLQLAFKLFGGEKGYITSDDLTSILGSAFDMTQEECETLFKLVDKDESGKIIDSPMHVKMQNKDPALYCARQCALITHQTLIKLGWIYCRLINLAVFIITSGVPQGSILGPL